MPRQTPEISGELVGEAFRLDDRLERAKQILKLQGLDLWQGDLAAMRNDLAHHQAGQTSPAAVPLGADLHQAAAALRLREALEKLQPPCRDLLYLHYVEGLSAAEVAGRLAISTMDAETRIHDCLKKAREIFEQQAIS